MRFFKSWPVHLALFLMGFLMLNSLAAFAFLEPSRETTVAMYDMKRAENIDIAFVGSSVSERHVDNAIIEKTLGLDSFNLSTSSVHSAATYAMVKELYQHHTPQIIVWIYDPTVDKEPLVVEANLWPHLTAWQTRLFYAWKNAEIDGAYLDRFFPWRQNIPDSAEKLGRYYEIKTDPDTYYTQSVEIYRSQDGTTINGYDGKGYHSIYREVENPRFHNELNQRIDRPKDLDVSMERATLRDMERLCEKNKSKLIVVSPPTIPQILLGDQKVVYVLDNMKQLCQESGVLYLDMARVKTELIPEDMMPYYYNAWHMNKDGAEIYSQALAQVLKEHLDGQDVSHYFYTPEEYAKTKNYVINGWYTQSESNGKITYTADCIYGADVEPQYQFSTIDETGETTVLRPFSKLGKYTCPQGNVDGKDIRVTIRNAANLDQEPVIAIKK